jgi:hypothetical protein
MQVGRVNPRSRLAALGTLLCLLAALFAIEAKLAWFSPALNTSAVSSSKLRPAEAPEVARQHTAQSVPLPVEIIENGAILAVTALTVAMMIVVRSSSRSLAPVSASSSFSVALFFRPPPAF